MTRGAVTINRSTAAALLAGWQIEPLLCTAHRGSCNRLASLAPSWCRLPNTAAAINWALTATELCWKARSGQSASPISSASSWAKRNSSVVAGIGGRRAVGTNRGQIAPWRLPRLAALPCACRCLDMSSTILSWHGNDAVSCFSPMYLSPLNSDRAMHREQRQQE